MNDDGDATVHHLNLPRPSVAQKQRELYELLRDFHGGDPMSIAQFSEYAVNASIGYFAEDDQEIGPIFLCFAQIVVAVAEERGREVLGQ